jgi:hypothetical protein
MQFGSKLVLVVATMAVCSLVSSAHSQEMISSGPHPLFANQYTQDSAEATAQMYLAPVPVPAWVGHTYYTYQPLYPHQMMYLHKDRYHSYYDGGRGLNRTKVHYSVPPLRTAIKSLYNAVSIPRPY